LDQSHQQFDIGVDAWKVFARPAHNHLYRRRPFPVVSQEVFHLAPFQICENSRKHAKASLSMLD